MRAEFEVLRAELPEPLRDELDRPGQRSTPEELNMVRIGLCAWRPLRLAELATLTGKSVNLCECLKSGGSAKCLTLRLD